MNLFKIMQNVCGLSKNEDIRRLVCKLVEKQTLMMSFDNITTRPIYQYPTMREWKHKRKSKLDAICNSRANQTHLHTCHFLMSCQIYTCKLHLRLYTFHLQTSLHILCHDKDLQEIQDKNVGKM